MNVFEDLVVELQEQNLLEKPAAVDHNRPHAAESGKPEATGNLRGGETPRQRTKGNAESAAPRNFKIEASGLSTPPPADPEHTSVPQKPKNGAEFYKKRAVGELSNLQMVEHVLTGIEREHMKIVPKVFDDFAAKKALNTFLQVAENENSEKHAEAEFELMTQTESWCSALGQRDADVQVSSLRLYCENSRPPLSSQALVALARFYRNQPYTEPVRAKFDFVMTRLFSRQSEQGERVRLFEGDDILNHINTLYKDWSSIALYSAGENDSDSLLAALSFEDLAIEAENTSTFDQLIQTGFFSRLRVFKESISELFYAPHVTAAAIDCNIRVGNVYVNLLSRERERRDAESLQTKYGPENDDAASDAAGHTLDFVGILSEIHEPAKAAEKAQEREPPPPSADQQRLDAQLLTSTRPPRPEPPAKLSPAAAPRTAFFGNFVENALGMNKWFLGMSLGLIALSIGIYVWANLAVSNDATTTGVETVQISNPVAQEHVKTARLSGETFYALMHPSWEQLPKEKRIEVLKAVYQVAVEKGGKQVRLTTHNGKNAGFATATRVEVEMP